MSVFKIAPGKNARFWENNDCLDNRHICVGWSKVRDLKKYRSEEELRAAVNEKQYRGRAPGRAASTAWQLWTLRNLEVGDKVVANKGNSIVLRVGTVNGRYKWNAKHEHHPHTVSVDWGAPCKRRKIRAQKEWNNNTVAQVSPELFALIARKLRLKDTSIDGAQKSPVSQNELTILGRLEEERRVSTRKEQQRLRKHLLDGKDYGWCFLCGEKLPAELLVAAHIKKRSKCTDTEKRDHANVVPMCLLGCDALFERGHVALLDNKIDTRLKSAAPRSRLYAVLMVLRARKIEIEVRRKKYFEWHSKHAL
jgi:hypothetical protein